MPFVKMVEEEVYLFFRMDIKDLIKFIQTVLNSSAVPAISFKLFIEFLLWSSSSLPPKRAGLSCTSTFC